MSGSPGDAVAGVLRARLEAIRGRIAAAARRSGRRPEDVTLVGVAKRHPPGQVVAAVEAGLGHVAENFAQEARDKVPAVAEALAERAVPAPRWHFIGQLQRNKVRLVVPLFDRIESVDRLSLAEEISRRAVALEREMEVLLQVDLSHEAGKGGASTEAVGSLLRSVAALPALRVVGLMAVPAPATDPEAVRPSFARLRRLREELAGAPGGEALRDLSMGMSSDFEVAVEEGATHVRVGTALFGPRPDTGGPAGPRREGGRPAGSGQTS